MLGVIGVRSNLPSVNPLNYMHTVATKYDINVFAAEIKRGLQKASVDSCTQFLIHLFGSLYVLPERH